MSAHFEDETSSQAIKEPSGPTETRRFMSVMRKLGGFESYFHDEIEKKGTINVSTFVFSSLIDLFEHKELFHKAVTLWKQTQPFLCSRVIAPERSNRYFVYTSDDKIHRSDNISYLYFKRERNSESIDDCKDYWKLLIEREFSIPIDWKNGPMWRLTLVKLKPNDLADKFEYCMISTATHAIFDGQSAFASLAGLFTLVENLYTDKFQVEHLFQAKVADSIEQTVNAHLEKNPIECEFNHVEPFKHPRNFMVKNFYSDRKFYISVDELNKPDADLKGAFYSDFDQSEVISLKALVELSKESLTKLYFIKLGGEKFKNFLVNCKKKGTKVTSVINMMFIIAWRLAYENLLDDEKSTQLASELSSDSSDRYPILTNTSLNSARTQPINYSTIVNLRGYLKEYDPDSLAWLCNSLYSRFDIDTDLSDSQFWTHKFWELARQESESFHARLKRGEQFKVTERLTPLQDGESRIHYGLSNLVVPSYVIQHLELFKIDELYTTASYRQGWSNDFSYHNVISLGDTLCWVVSYNSNFIKNEAIKIFVNSVLDIYDILCAV